MSYKVSMFWVKVMELHKIYMLCVMQYEMNEGYAFLLGMYKWHLQGD